MTDLALPPCGPAPMPAAAAPADHLTPLPLYTLGFRGYTVHGVECILPPLCAVPAGEFLLGSDKRQDSGTYDEDLEAYDNELPQHRLTLLAFQVARFPVTVAEYAYFVRAGQKQPNNWQSQLTKLDHPVVSVSWHNAADYVAWLAKTTSQPWRLPSEAEWEKAARWDGRTARIYPWGDTFDQSRCNTSESGIKATTPVGSYPSGASPCGAQEMAGNVWEWTRSVYKPYPYILTDGREAHNSTDNRVLRGGSWYDYAGDARAAFRVNLRPDFSSSFGSIGVRLVLAASAGS